MLFFHTADLHIGASMEANLPKEKAALRRREILRVFEEIVSQASTANADGVFLCGDIFDEKSPSPLDVREILDSIRAHPSVPFYWLRGNHDSMLHFEEGLPDNIRLFPKDSYGMYACGNTCIWGTEDPTLPPPEMDADKVNLVLLHGRTGESAGEDIIDLRAWRESGADRLALGHYHSFAETAVDHRLQAIYPGCPAGRGFDECGQKGYVTYRIDGTGVEHAFVPLGGRQFRTVSVDITEAETPARVQAEIESAISGIPHDDALKVELTGAVSPSFSIGVGVLTKMLDCRFWFVKIKDKTTVKLSQADYLHDLSLKGAFVRTVTEAVADEATRNKIIAYGIMALEGRGKEEDVL